VARPNNLLTQAAKWRAADVSANTGRVPGAKFVETGTCWGHFTMFNLREQDTAAIDAEALAG